MIAENVYVWLAGAQRPVSEHLGCQPEIFLLTYLWPLYLQSPDAWTYFNETHNYLLPGTNDTDNIFNQMFISELPLTFTAAP